MSDITPHQKAHYVQLPEFVDEMCSVLATEGGKHLRRLGFKGIVVVNIEWTEDPGNGHFAIGSKVPSGATSLLVQSLRHSADEVEEAIAVSTRSADDVMCPKCGVPPGMGCVRIDYRGSATDYPAKGPHRERTRKARGR